MTPKLTQEQYDALHSNGNEPLPVVDPTNQHVYFVVDGETHRQGMAALRQREDLEAIRRGVDDMEAGRGIPIEEARTQTESELRIRYQK